MQFLNARDGNVAMLFAFSALVMAAGGGVTLDMSRAANAREMLQAATDAAALEAAVALREAPRSYQQRGAAVFAANVQRGAWESAPTVTLTHHEHRVDAHANAVVPSLLGAIAGIESVAIAAKAAATTESGPPICALSMEAAANKAIEFSGRSEFSADNCVVYANSSAGNALHITGQAAARANGFCAVGGFAGAKTRFSPAPSESCTPIVDPGYDIPSAKLGPCTSLNTVEVGAYMVLAPGRYCDGLTIKGRARMAPGVYVMDDEGLKVEGDGELSGDGVVIRFNGDGGRFEFTNNAQVVLSAPKAGAYAGLVMAGDRLRHVGSTGSLSYGVAYNVDSKIDDDAEIKLTGTVYLPNQNLSIKGRAQVGIGTKYIAFFTNTVQIDDDASVVLSAQPTSEGYEDRLPRAYFMPRLMR